MWTVLSGLGAGQRAKSKKGSVSTSLCHAWLVVNPLRLLETRGRLGVKAQLTLGWNSRQSAQPPTFTPRAALEPASPDSGSSTCRTGDDLLLLLVKNGAIQGHTRVIVAEFFDDGLELFFDMAVAVAVEQMPQQASLEV